MPALQNTRANSIFRLQLVLLVSLLINILAEDTIIGRAYTHLLGLNEGIGKTVMAGDPVTVGGQSILLVTLAIPFFMLMVSKPARASDVLPLVLIRVGLGLWLCGGAISTLAHFDNALVLLNYAAGIGSAAMVFYAVRRVRMSSIRQFEWAFVAIAIPGLILGLATLFVFYRKWGIPSVATMIHAKYDLDRTIYQNFLFGNLDPHSANTLYNLLVCPCLVVACTKMFGRTARWVARATLICSSANVVLSMSRASLAALAISFLLAVAFLRTRRVLMFCGVTAILAMFLMSDQAIATLQKYLTPAMTYDVDRDTSAASRVESIKEGWREFEEHPLIGVGAAQSSTVMAEWVSHELSVSQATEHGVFGFAGVLLITVACIARLLKLLRIGGSSERARLEFAFFLGPALFFIRGVYAEVFINATVVNVPICLTFAMLALASTGSRRLAPIPARIVSDDLSLVAQQLHHPDMVARTL
jgi:hypothetical protein